MYQLISAIAKPLDGDLRWKEVAIGNIALNVLFSTYSRIIATLSNPFLPENVAVDLDTIRPIIGGSSITFNAFLIENANNALTTLTDLPVINTRYARYADAFHAGYKITPIHPTASIDADLPPSEKTWLHLARPDTDYVLFYKSCLVSINGFFHATDANEEGVLVNSGMKSAMISGENQIGIYSFRELGELTFFPITEEMVFKQNDRQTYRERAYVDLGVDVSDKSVFLVLGGYLHALDKKTFYRTGPGTFAIDFSNLPLMDRYYESRNYIDLSSLDLDTTDRNDSQVGVDNFLSDATLLAYLTLSQSFFVVLDNNDIFVTKSPVRKTPLPDMFIGYEKPFYPLVVGMGRVTNYWYTHEDGQYSLTCHDTLRNNRLYDTVDFEKQISVSNANDPENPTYHSAPFFLKIGRDL